MNKWLWAKIASQVSAGVGTAKTAVAGLNRKVFIDHSDGRKIVAIEQNPKTNSEWAKMAQQGRKVVQFKDTATNKYVAVSVDGKVKEY